MTNHTTRDNVRYIGGDIGGDSAHGRDARRRRIRRRVISLAATALLASVAAAGIVSGFDISDTGSPATPPATRTSDGPNIPG